MQIHKRTSITYEWRLTYGSYIMWLLSMVWLLTHTRILSTACCKPNVLCADLKYYDLNRNRWSSSKWLTRYFSLTLGYVVYNCYSNDKLQLLQILYMNLNICYIKRSHLWELISHLTCSFIIKLESRLGNMPEPHEKLGISYISKSSTVT